MKETRYVLCDFCGGKIYLNSEVYCCDGYCGVYCSAECFTNAYATEKVLDEDEAENCRCNILDDEAIEKEKADIQKEIFALQNKLNKLNNLQDHKTKEMVGDV